MRTYFMFPTRNRIKKVKETLKTIDHPEIEPFIVSDGDNKSAHEFGCMLVDHHVGSVMARNYALEKLRGDVLCGMDDIAFIPGMLKKVLALFKDSFPDSDGVVGLRQAHEHHHKSGVALVGDKFLERYPKRWLFCPYYYHFACQEIQEHADRLDKFIYTDFVCLEHKSPQRTDGDNDSTHQDARVYKDRDKSVRRIRKHLGLIWGYNG